VKRVGPGFTVEVKTAAGKDVKTLKAGTYTIKVEDKATTHNFHLIGPGLNKSTTVPFKGDQTWTIKLKAGKYTYQCDPHAARGIEGQLPRYRLGEREAISPSWIVQAARSSSRRSIERLVANARKEDHAATPSASPRCSRDRPRLGLCGRGQEHGHAQGRGIRELGLQDRDEGAERQGHQTVKAGTYSVKVEDKGTIHNFHLTGPGVNKSTSVAVPAIRRGPSSSSPAPTSSCATRTRRR